jgi:thiol-disulfide isomerase/thioredoxin
VGCSSDDTDAVPKPGEPKIEVDTPELRQAKADAGIEDCAPGTASSALPAVTLPCLGGGPDVDLSTLQGPMIVNFWFAACGPCRTEMPVLGDFHRRYGDRVPVLGVDSLDTVPGLALELAGKRDATYPQLADPGGELTTEPVFANSNKGRPYLAFVDASGQVAGEEIGGVTSIDELVGLVDEHLGLDLAAP